MTESADTRARLAAIAVRRDVDGFARLIAENRLQVRTFLLRLCRDYDVADDLAQDTFVLAFQKLATFRGTGSFQGWLCRIAYRRFLQYLRDTRRRRQIMDQYHGILDVEPDRYETITDLQIDLERAMSVLSYEEAAAITLGHSFGFSHQEVANILDTPLGSVKSRISRGRDKLKQALLAAPDDARPEEVTDGRGAEEGFPTSQVPRKHL